MATNQIDQDLLEELINILRSPRRSLHDLEVITYFCNSLSTIRTFTKHLSKSKLLELAQFYKLEKYVDSQFLFYKGDPSDKLYIVLQGCIELIDIVQGQQQILTAIVGPGNTIGERGLAKNLHRSLVARAKGAAIVMTLDKEKFRYYMLEQVYAHLKEKLDFIDRYIPGMRSFSTSQKEKLSYSFQTALFSKGETLLEQGKYINFLYFIVDGECILTKNTAQHKITISTLGRGCIIGDENILLNNPSSYTITVSTDRLKTYKVSKHEINILLPEKTLDMLRVYLSTKLAGRSNLHDRIASMSKGNFCTSRLYENKFSRAAPTARRQLIKIDQMYKKRNDVFSSSYNTPEASRCRNILEGLGVNSLATLRRNHGRAVSKLSPEPEVPGSISTRSAFDGHTRSSSCLNFV